MDEHGACPLNPQAVLKTLKRYIPSQQSQLQLWVGFSGGLDSSVLLHLVHQVLLETQKTQETSMRPSLRKTAEIPFLLPSLSSLYKLGAVHVHHGLHPNADDWALHCQTLCQRLNIPFHILKISLPPLKGRSLEEVARDCRYQAFIDFLGPDHYLLLAHHQMDQAETLLLRLLRGAGPQGLSAMKPCLSLGQGKMLRPLLSCSKESLLEYANNQQLSWIEDDSNTNTRFDRNFLRQEILPPLVARWPQAVNALCRTAELCSDASEILESLAAKDFELVKAEHPHQLSVVKLLTLTSGSRQAAIRYWLRTLKLPLPSRDQLARIEREVLEARSDRKPKLKIGDYEILRLKGRLICRDYQLPEESSNRGEHCF